MAYLRELKVECDEQYCTSRAMQELLNSRNEAIGRFCRKHGKLRLKQQQVREGQLPMATNK